MMVSRNRPATRDRQAPLTGKPQPVGMAMITEPAEGAHVCSCTGFTSTHPRRKVREKRAERHVNDKHGGVALWL